MVQSKSSVAAALKAALRVGAWLVLAGAFAGAVAGCGQKGPLMLPQPASAASAPTR